MKRASLQLTILALAIAMTAAYVPAQEVQWTTWATEDGGNGHEYAILMGELTWLEQADAAAQLGGYLATLQSLAEHDFVWELIRDAEAVAPSSSAYYAFGLIQTLEGEETYADRAKGWGWITGEPYNEADAQWGYREPSNSGGYENYGFIHKTRKNYYGYPYWWNDGNNAGAYRAIVEREEPPVPEDTTPPDTSLDPADPASLAWSDTPVTVTISGTVTDDESGVDSATLLIDDEYGDLSGEQVVTDLLQDGAFTTTIDLAAVTNPGDADGRVYTISLLAEDVAGNVADPVSVTVTAVGDTTAPSTSLNPADPSSLAWGDTPVAVTVSGSVTDDESGVASATLMIDDEYGTLTGEQSVTGLQADGTFTTSVSLAPTADPLDADGRTYTISLIATDNMGNASQPVSVTVTVPPDTTAPVVALESPEPAQLPWKEPDVLKDVVITGTVTDTESGVKSATLEIVDEYGEFDAEIDVTMDLDEAGNFERTLQLSSRIEGGDKDGRSYIISLIAEDHAGNISAPAVASVVAQRPSSGGPPKPPNRPVTPPGHGNRPDNPPGRGR